jgi:5-formyltetrahydrofolate cyclo-ligase
MSDSAKEASIKSEKDTLRESIKRKLHLMGKQEKEDASDSISEKIIEKVREKSSVLCYSPLQSEPNIWPAIKYWLKSDIRVCLPKVEGNSIESYAIKETENLIRSSMGILEPDPSIHAKVNTMEIDFIIIPGIGFSRDGKRLGRGGGYYDRYLETTLEQTLKIGVAFSLQIIAEIPMQTHDIAVDLLITD